MARKGITPRSTKQSVRTDRVIEHHVVIISGILEDKFCDKGPREWTKQALKSLEEAMELNMNEVIAESSF
jgi:hypothetical protein